MKTWSLIKRFCFAASPCNFETISKGTIDSTYLIEIPSTNFIMKVIAFSFSVRYCIRVKHRRIITTGALTKYLECSGREKTYGPDALESYIVTPHDATWSKISFLLEKKTLLPLNLTWILFSHAALLTLEFTLCWIRKVAWKAFFLRNKWGKKSYNSAEIVKCKNALKKNSLDFGHLWTCFLSVSEINKIMYTC